MSLSELLVFENNSMRVLTNVGGWAQRYIHQLGYNRHQ